MSRILIILLALALPPLQARADVSVSIGVAVPGVSIGIHVPAYPRLVRIPGHPVYYDPYLSLNLFFFDGVYWVFYAGNWYMSTWYDGPWYYVPPLEVPIYILRVPIRYYRVPPPFFHGHVLDAPPPWHEHWGREWAERRRDWQRHPPPPPPAPRPLYQRQFGPERYPHDVERQRELHREHYGWERERRAPPGHEKRDKRERGQH